MWSCCVACTISNICTSSNYPRACESTLYRSSYLHTLQMLHTYDIMLHHPSPKIYCTQHCCTRYYLLLRVIFTYLPPVGCLWHYTWNTIVCVYVQMAVGCINAIIHVRWYTIIYNINRDCRTSAAVVKNKLDLNFIAEGGIRDLRYTHGAVQAAARTW